MIPWPPTHTGHHHHHILPAVESAIALHPTHVEDGEVVPTSREASKDGVVVERTMKTTHLRELARAASGPGMIEGSAGGAPGASVVMIVVSVGNVGEATIVTIVTADEEEVEEEVVGRVVVDRQSEDATSVTNATNVVSVTSVASAAIGKSLPEMGVVAAGRRSKDSRLVVRPAEGAAEGATEENEEAWCHVHY